MAGEIRQLTFSEGVSVVAPSQAFLTASKVGVYADTAAFLTAKGDVAAEGDIFENSTSNQINFYNGSAWVEVASSVGVQTLAGAKTFSDTTDSTDKDTGAVIVEGGVGIEKNLNVGANVKIASTTDSTDKDTGALVVEGGVGIEKNLHVGVDLTVAGNMTVSGTTTTVDTTNTTIKDANIELNKGGDDASSEGSGLTIERTGTNGSIIYADSATSKFKAGAAGSEKELATIDGAQVITNKDIQGGTPSDTNRTVLPKDTTANLDGLTDVQGLIAYDTTLDAPTYNNGAGWRNVAGVGGTASDTNQVLLPKDTSANLDLLTDVQGSFGYDTTQDAPVYNDGTGWQTIGTAGSTVMIDAPSITAPVSGTLGIDFSSNITTSAFATTGGADTHDSTDWEIVDQSNTLVFSSYEDADNLVSINISSENFTASKTYKIRARHVGVSYGESSWSDYSYFTTAASIPAVDQPSITNPADAEVDFEPEGDAITSSAYNASGAETHVHSDWEMRLGSTNAVVASSYDDTTNKESKNFANSLLSESTVYRLRARHNGSSSGDSLWSDYITVMTPSAFPSVDTPSVTYPTTGPDLTDVDFGTAFTTSAFNLSDEASVAGSHASTDWQIATDTGFTALVKDISQDTTNKTSYNFNSGDFSTSTTYYMRVRHYDANYGASSWSPTRTFGTAAVLLPQPIHKYDFRSATGSVAMTDLAGTKDFTDVNSMTFTTSGIHPAGSGASTPTDQQCLTQGTLLDTIPSGGFAIAVRVNLDLLTDPLQFICFKQPLSDEEFYIRFDTDQFDFGAKNSLITSYFSTGAAVSATTWYRVVFSWDTTNGVRVFINESSQTTPSDTELLTLPSSGTYSDFVVGAYQPGGSASENYGLDGYISHLEIYGGILSDAEIIALSSNLEP